MIRRPPRSTPLYSSAASDVYKRQREACDEKEGEHVVQTADRQAPAYEGHGQAPVNPAESEGDKHGHRHQRDLQQQLSPCARCRSQRMNGGPPNTAMIIATSVAARILITTA